VSFLLIHHLDTFSG